MRAGRAWRLANARILLDRRVATSAARVRTRGPDGRLASHVLCNKASAAAICRNVIDLRPVHERARARPAGTCERPARRRRALDKQRCLPCSALRKRVGVARVGAQPADARKFKFRFADRPLLDGDRPPDLRRQRSGVEHRTARDEGRTRRRSAERGQKKRGTPRKRRLNQLRPRPPLGLRAVPSAKNASQRGTGRRPTARPTTSGPEGDRPAQSTARAATLLSHNMPHPTT